MLHAIVTGHSRGLGAAIATELRDRGAVVLGLARGDGPAGVRGVPLDLGDPAALQQWIERGELARFVADASSVALINNAGTVQPVGPPGRQGAEAIARAVSLNVAAPLMLTDAVLAAAPAGLECRIVHLSSGAARRAYAGWSIYCATKAALDLHAQALAMDALPGVRVESLAPGVIDTSMQAELRATPQTDFPQRPRFEALHREGGLSAPRDAAQRLVDHLLSASFGLSATTDLRELAR